ncbi:hypothetical protein [Microbispora rosea]
MAAQRARQRRTRSSSPSVTWAVRVPADRVRDQLLAGRLVRPGHTKII